MTHCTQTSVIRLWLPSNDPSISKHGLAGTNSTMDIPHQPGPKQLIPYTQTWQCPENRLWQRSQWPSGAKSLTHGNSEIDTSIKNTTNSTSQIINRQQPHSMNNAISFLLLPKKHFTDSPWKHAWNSKPHDSRSGYNGVTPTSISNSKQPKHKQP